MAKSKKTKRSGGPEHVADVVNRIMASETRRHYRTVKAAAKKRLRDPKRCTKDREHDLSELRAAVTALAKLEHP